MEKCQFFNEMWNANTWIIQRLKQGDQKRTFKLSVLFSFVNRNKNIYGKRGQRSIFILVIQIDRFQYVNQIVWNCSSWNLAVISAEPQWSQSDENPPWELSWPKKNLKSFVKCLWRLDDKTISYKKFLRLLSFSMSGLTVFLARNWI